MADRVYIDINTAVGRTSNRDVRFPYDAKTLEKEMVYYGINGYATVNSEGLDYSFVKGNREILRMAEDNKRIIPCGIIIPTLKYECDDWRGYLDGLVCPAEVSKDEKDGRRASFGMKAFHTYPVAMNYRFDPRNIKDLAEYMIEKSLPLIIDHGQFEFRDLENVLAAFPALKVIYCKSPHSQTRNLFSLLDTYPNIYIDLCTNQSNNFLSLCKKHFGVDRILFSSGYPYMCPGAAKGTLEYSDLTDEEKNMVAHGNVANLLGINISDFAPYSPEQRGLDPIAEMVDKGEKLEGFTVIDTHVHTMDEDDFTQSSTPLINISTNNLIKKMDRMGVDKAFVSIWEGLITDGIAANETAIKEKLKHGDRLEFYATCNPNYLEELDAIISSHERMKSVSENKYSFIGIKPYYVFNGYDLEGTAYDNWYEYADTNKLIALMHVDRSCSTVTKVNNLAKKYKNITFIMAHGGQFYEVSDRMIQVIKDNENVYMDLTYSTVTYGIIEYIVSKIGSNKIVYGSDSLMREPSTQLAWYCFAKISVEDKKKILGENAKKIMEER